LFANNRNRVRGAVLGLSQDGACTDLFENLSVNSLKGDLSNDTTFKPPLFSLVNTFKGAVSEAVFALLLTVRTDFPLIKITFITCQTLSPSPPYGFC
jgi:hypothetical protein